MNERADHTGYIRAVIAHLAEDDVRVTKTSIGTTSGLRWAQLDLEPEDCPRLTDGETHYVVSWDEEEGWGVCAALERGGRSEIYHHGLRVDPPAATAALWVLGNTLEFYPPREDGPFRHRTDASPELEKFLADFS
ncbi:hypothetical protein [Nocardiopsis algeriensis]|uniref:Uncharacterized protein n=1 Tax=Nocardiopsis algeriensis TaxID=1478215 RepID=A0A841IN73_9ACTN|nr:hypothetical protein [Nocardiopsis algeriensis]MBB6119502.1 hypothetical protein [Nocardiopsis algeriensis]